MSVEENQAKNIAESIPYLPRMKPNKTGNLNILRTFGIGIAFLTSSAFWGYYNFIMPPILKRFLIEDFGMITGVNTIVGIIMALDNLIAIFLLPIFGVLSDKTKSKYGKRTPFIIIGCILSLILFSIIGIISFLSEAAAFIALFAVILFFNLSMAFYRTASVSLMPDLTESSKRSTANSIINLMGGFGMILALVTHSISSLFFNNGSEYGENLTRGVTFFIISALVGIFLIIFLFSIKETPTGTKFLEIGEKSIEIDPITFEYVGEKKTEKKTPIMHSLKVVFFEKEKSALVMLLVIFVWFFGFTAIETFYSTYAIYYLGWSEVQASQTFLVVPISMISSAYFSGLIAEKIGRKKTILSGLVFLSIILFLTIFISSDMELNLLGLIVIISVKTQFILSFALIGIAYGLININTIVMIWEMAPKDKIGAYTGVYYFFAQMASVLGPIFIGFCFDLYKLITGVQEGEQYIILFPYVIFCEIIAILLLLKVKKGESEKFLSEKK